MAVCRATRLHTGHCRVVSLSARPIKLTITTGALVLAAVRLVWPDLALDGVTAALLAIAVLPWLGPVFKSVRLPGGLEVEYQDLEKIEERARVTGLLAGEPQTVQRTYTFQSIGATDPNLALAGLRIELERRLIRLAESRGVPVPRVGLNQVLRLLNERELINGQERAVLSDLAGLLNAAVHGASAEPSAAQWALDIGPQILGALDRRSDAAEIGYEGIA